MKSFIVLALFATVAFAAPADDRDAVVIRNVNDNIGVDGFNASYETSNGIAGNAQGTLKDVGQENPALEVRGQYSYVAPDGITYTVTYIANENGYQPQGAHLPQPQ